MAVGGAVSTQEVAFPSGKEVQAEEGNQVHQLPYPLPFQINEAKGAFVLAPQDPQASECLAGIQVAYPEQDRKGWDDLAADNSKLADLLRQGYEDRDPMVRSAMDAMVARSQDMYIWPFHTMPRLESWASSRKRVVLLGDSAHAIPPTAGQGANQAFEDTFSFAILMVKFDSQGPEWSEALRTWQAYRQERVEKVLALTGELNERRKPRWTGAPSSNMDASWLYGVDVSEAMSRLLDSQVQSQQTTSA